MAAARRGIAVRDFVLWTLYAELNRELSDSFMDTVWQPKGYEELREQRKATREQRSVAARTAAMARWHPELCVAKHQSSDQMAVTAQPVSAPRISRATAKSCPSIRCPVSVDHPAQRRDDGVWCPACEKHYILLSD